MWGALVSRRQAAVRRAVGAVWLVNAAGAPRDDRAAHGLDCSCASQRPEVGVRDPREAALDGLQNLTGLCQASVGAVLTLRAESHGGAVGAAGVACLVVRARRMPCQPHKHRAVAAVVVALHVEHVEDGVLHGLVVFLWFGRGAGGQCALLRHVGVEQRVRKHAADGDAAQEQPSEDLRGVAYCTTTHDIMYGGKVAHMAEELQASRLVAGAAAAAATGTPAEH
mmetsp:Transcript_42165/g.126273  ORF Transcript_42165/g.126273 Transcript_42165/m.126273 type:complete len:224 (-) Transcript_42165:383-1054(-)